MKITESMKWTREPAECTINADRIEITTKPHTDLWQRTYYHFRNVIQAMISVHFFIISSYCSPGGLVPRRGWCGALGAACL